MTPRKDRIRLALALALVKTCPKDTPILDFVASFRDSVQRGKLRATHSSSEIELWSRQVELLRDELSEEQRRRRECEREIVRLQTEKPLPEDPPSPSSKATKRKRVGPTDSQKRQRRSPSDKPSEAQDRPLRTFIDLLARQNQDAGLPALSGHEILAKLRDFDKVLLAASEVAKLAAIRTIGDAAASIFRAGMALLQQREACIQTIDAVRGVVEWTSQIVRDFYSKYHDDGDDVIEEATITQQKLLCKEVSLSLLEMEVGSNRKRKLCGLVSTITASFLPCSLALCARYTVPPGAKTPTQPHADDTRPQLVALLRVVSAFNSRLVLCALVSEATKLCTAGKSDEETALELRRKRLATNEAVLYIIVEIERLCNDAQVFTEAKDGLLAIGAAEAIEKVWNSADSLDKMVQRRVFSILGRLYNLCYAGQE